MKIHNAPGHPQSISIENENIPVVFLPPNTTSLLQPLDQDTISCVKALYTRQFLEMVRKSCNIWLSVLSAVSRNGVRFWKYYSRIWGHNCFYFCIWHVEWREKFIICTNSDCVLVDLIDHHSMSVCHFYIILCAVSGCSIFFSLSHTQRFFQKCSYWTK
jgi:hypothetical protein